MHLSQACEQASTFSQYFSFLSTYLLCVMPKALLMKVQPLPDAFSKILILLLISLGS